MNTGSDLNLSSGCRDRLMIASSVACVVALFISILGLARALFDLTWPLGQSGANQICLQVGHAESDLPSSTLARAAPRSTSRSRRPPAGLGPTITPMPPTATLDPTITSMPPAPTPVPSAALSTTMQITAQMVYSATTGHPFQAPILLNPEPDAPLQSEVHFQWQWDGQPLPEGLAFDLLIWSETEHQEHQGTGAHGVIETGQSLESDVDLDYVQTIIDHGGGTYFWTVIVVQEEPYKRVGAWGEKRPFTYTVPEPPAEPPTQSP
jgi:hypothetical protein